jgi:hypothetical protein
MKLRKSLAPLAIAIGMLSGAAHADTQTVAANVAFVADVTATVNQAIEFGTLVKADGACDMTSDTAALSGVGCASGAVSGTPAVGIVQVDGGAGVSIQIDVDATAASDTGIIFTPNMVNSTADTTPLGITAVAQTLTGGQQFYHLYGGLNITSATVLDNPTMSVDFTVVYN